MLFFIVLIFDIVCLLLAVPVALLFLEIIAALVLPARQNLLQSKSDVRQPVAVLVPAHNESAGIVSTLNDINAQLLPGDRLLVVADNCVDDTAVIAAAAGAEVIKRDDRMRKGKGYALEFGVKHLSANPPAIVIIVDADCRVAEGAIDRLARTCAATQRPVQALDLMTAPDGSAINYCVAEFAWRVKNWVRPLGLNALSLPCQLMGTGMAFPWNVICSAKLASGSVVEDLKLGLDLVQLGSSPLFCPSARVTSDFPQSAEGASGQRKRWEGGHVNMILSAFPRLIYAGVMHRNLDQIVLTMDLAIPPLSILAILLSIEFFVASIAAFFGFTSAALLISLASIVVFALGIFICWLKYGRDILPPSAFLSVASYVFGKLPIYRQFLAGGTALQWTRTDRKN